MGRARDRGASRASVPCLPLPRNCIPAAVLTRSPLPRTQAAASYGCEVDTLTLSVEQKNLAEERIRERGLVGRVRVHLMDYRDVPADWEHAFDAFVSIEMLEHVGSKVSPES